MSEQKKYKMAKLPISSKAKTLEKRKQKLNEQKSHIKFIEEKLMLLIQVMQHWGAIRMSQDGELYPVFEASRNMVCAWLDSDAKCVNPDCNWCEGQCIFTAKFDQCKFYMAMIDPPKEDATATSDVPTE